MATKFYDRLSNDLTQLLENPIDYNVTIGVGEEPVSQTFKVHSYILQSRSPYFKKKFNESPFSENHVKELKIPNISVKVFNVIIKYIYGGTISLEKFENSIIFDLLMASQELDLDELVEHLQTHLITNNASWLRLNFAHVYQTSYQVKNFKIIQNFCDNIISKHPNTIFESENFISLPRDVLISIIRLDDLQLEEYKIWDYVIQWGKAKNPNLPADLNEWTSDNFLTLKTTLKHCLPHIRYFNFSGEQVVKKLYPYQQLFEPKLLLEINTKLLAPNEPISSTILPPRNILNVTLPTRTNPIPSNIITDEHALEISSWIDKTRYTENNPYAFKLLVRGSKDGFDVKTILEICDKVSNTVIIVKVEDLNEWTSDNFLTLKTTLKHCLPHIRYFNFSGEQVVKKLYPYQQLFEPKLLLEINTKLLAPNEPISSTILPPRNILNVTLPTRTNPIPSNIITDEHALEISSWIDKTRYTENNPYAFKLLVRGSKDGFDVKTILEICDKVSNTVIIVKVEGTGEIIGGYNPLEIQNNDIGWCSSQDSFIFSLKTQNLKNSIISRVTDFNFAIYYFRSNSWLQFGNALSLRSNLKTESSFCGIYYYEKQIRSNTNGFSVEEVEVFKVSPRNN
ncbi:hypothetical protein Glove_476g90 [Diversispora epigaea]|uniref:BTB domain-containing protein n=1 Tax=Diversispora epigaea TaxID=1348612 RepID=A0A397GPF2_9GLOM|nr:hypothetical protein Glove_476g90 [Diversispora epigaea]